MASDLHYLEYVREQMRGAGDISFRKMFGEYALYLDGKVVALVCDNQAFVKLTDAGAKLLGHFIEGRPYPGAKPWIAADEYLDDEELLVRLIRSTANALPAPAPKRSAAKRSGSGRRHRKPSVKPEF